MEDKNNGAKKRIMYSVNELAAAFGVSRQWIHEQIRVRNIASVKIGGKRLIPASEVDRITSTAI